MSLTALDIADAERWARLRSLRLGVRVICRGRAPELERALAAAEHDRREIPASSACLAACVRSTARALATWAQTLT